MNDRNSPSAPHSPFAWVDEVLFDLAEHDLLRSLTARQGPQSALIDLDGRNLVSFGSNDYLGLASDSRVVRSAAQACDRWGVGGGASPLITGRTTLHLELERKLAAFLRSEAALLFPAGFAAGAGTIPALVDKGDVILADAKNHASLVDGCRLSRAARFIYAHADPRELEARLRDAATARRRLIVTDSLFSMDGDLAPLEEVLRLAEHHNAMVLLDEAHAVGVFGENGRGVLEHLGLERAPGADRLIRVATLSKAFGAAGGFVCGPRCVIEWLTNRARTFVFSTAAPAPVLAAALAGLEIAKGEPHRRQELLSRAAMLRARLQEQGWNTGRSIGQIVPVIVGGARSAMELAGALRDRGFFVPAIRPPTVPPGESLLRVSLCFHHTEAMIDGLTQALAELRHPLALAPRAESGYNGTPCIGRDGAMNETCTLTIRRTETGYVFRIAGRGTMRESPAVRDFICGAIEDGADVVADLSACEYLDSTFLGCLVLLHKRGQSDRGSFAVHADETTRNTLLSTVGLHRVLDFVDKCPECTGPPVTLALADLERREFWQHLLETHRKLAELGGPSAETFRRIADQMAKELGDAP